jgi:hypothetical protein
MEGRNFKVFLRGRFVALAFFFSYFVLALKKKGCKRESSCAARGVNDTDYPAAGISD